MDKTLQELKTMAINLLAENTSVQKSIMTKRLITIDIHTVAEKMSPMMSTDNSSIIEWLDKLFDEEIATVLLKCIEKSHSNKPVPVPTKKEKHKEPVPEYGLKVTGHTSNGKIYYYSIETDIVHWVVKSQFQRYLEKRDITPKLTVICDSPNDADNKVQAYLHEYKGEYKYKYKYK